MRAALIVTAWLGSTGARAAPELVVRGDGIVPASVNGVAGRIRIDPATPAVPLLSPFWVMKARIKPGPFGFGYLVGPREVAGVSAVARIAVGAGAPPLRRRVGWTRYPYINEADGVIGPGGLPPPLIRFMLRPPMPGERTVTLPLVDEGGLFGRFGGMYALVDVGGRPMRIRFDPHHPRTLATAGAGARLAAAYDGRIGGETASVPIAFGIARPVRTLRLAKPLQIGALTISTLGVRTADFGNASGIREAGGDPDEIVVTAKARNEKRDRISLGADSLARCSSILFDKRARKVRLTCA